MIEERVYSTIPDNHKEEIQQKERDRVITMLIANDERMVTSKIISLNCGLDVKGSCIKLRNIVADLRDKGCPIISNQRGFAWTKSPEKLQACIDSLDLRILGIERAINGLKLARDKLL